MINLAQGVWSTDGAFRTTQEDADAIVDEHLAAARAAARQRGKPLRVLVFAPGGLVDEASGLGIAHKQLAWWKANGVYPLYFVWETGLAGTVKRLRAHFGLAGRPGAAEVAWSKTDPAPGARRHHEHQPRRL